MTTEELNELSDLCDEFENNECRSWGIRKEHNDRREVLQEQWHMEEEINHGQCLSMFL